MTEHMKHHMILDENFAKTIIHDALGEMAKREASTFAINYVNSVADAVSRSFILASMDGYGNEAEAALAGIVKKWLEMHMEQKLHYMSAVWPSIFTCRLAEVLGQPVVDKALENSGLMETEEFDEFNRDLADFHANLTEWCESVGRRGNNPGSNNSVKHKSVLDKLDYAVPNDLKSLAEELAATKENTAMPL